MQTMASALCSVANNAVHGNETMDVGHGSSFYLNVSNIRYAPAQSPQTLSLRHHSPAPWQRPANFFSSVRAFSVSVPTQRRRRRELLPAVLPAALRRLEPQRRAVQAVLQREYSARLHVLPGRSDRWPPGSDSPVEMLAQGDELLASARVGYVAKPTTPREANSLQEMGIPSMEDRMARTMDL